jgi:hypothetical protein
VTDFLSKRPTLDSNWRAVVLFGRNVVSYKFALAKTLLDMAGRADDRVPLEELAVPFARHLCEHLARVDRQATSRSSRFLDACRAFNHGELADDRLVATTARLGFNKSSTPSTWSAPARSRSASSSTSAAPAATPSASRTSCAGSPPRCRGPAWRLVETVWALDLPRAGSQCRPTQRGTCCSSSGPGALT